MVIELGYYYYDDEATMMLVMKIRIKKINTNIQSILDFCAIAIK
ncbi:MAG TPA: hypothetical protein VJR94_01785 [Candidatus Nitrosocosmicus sp.]|nr:hypothetical protein [Candidatus Nitrosocosmicus sp.]